MIRGPDLDQPALRAHERHVSVLQRLSQGLQRFVSEPILALATELAVESGRPLLSGYEMSEFSYFPDMAAERAQRLNVVTYDRLMRAEPAAGSATRSASCTPSDS